MGVFDAIIMTLRKISRVWRNTSPPIRHYAPKNVGFWGGTQHQLRIFGLLLLAIVTTINHWLALHLHRSFTGGFYVLVSICFERGQGPLRH